jgi:hypothetical protein
MEHAWNFDGGPRDAGDPELDREVFRRVFDYLPVPGVKVPPFSRDWGMATAILSHRARSPSVKPRSSWRRTGRGSGSGRSGRRTPSFAPGLEMKKLDFQHWEEPRRQYILALIDLLSSLDPKRIDEHLSLARRAPDRLRDSYYLEYPAAMGLLAYGAPGIDALYKLSISKDGPGAGAAAQALISAATNEHRWILGELTITASYLDDAAVLGLLGAVERNIRDPAVSALAREALSRAVHHFLTQRSGYGSLSYLLSIPGVMGQGTKDVEDLIIESIARSALQISDPLCDELESMIGRGLAERAYQSWFEAHPAFLDPLASSVVERQPLAEKWKTDFVIRRLDDEYLLVEIEKPQDSPFTAYPRPTRSLSHALAQILNWFAWLEDHISYAQANDFPGIHAPTGMVVIGRRSELSKEQSRMLGALNDQLYPRIRVLTYDDVLSNARNILRNLTSRAIPR